LNIRVITDAPQIPMGFPGLGSRDLWVLLGGYGCALEVSTQVSRHMKNHW